jgi:hypothetical protein
MHQDLKSDKMWLRKTKIRVCTNFGSEYLKQTNKARSRREYDIKMHLRQIGFADVHWVPK